MVQGALEGFEGCCDQGFSVWHLPCVLIGSGQLASSTLWQCHLIQTAFLQSLIPGRCFYLAAIKWDQGRIYNLDYKVISAKAISLGSGRGEAEVQKFKTSRHFLSGWHPSQWWDVQVPSPVGSLRLQVAAVDTFSRTWWTSVGSSGTPKQSWVGKHLIKGPVSMLWG